jgi:hypothetical protein
VRVSGFGRSENFLEGDELRCGSLACSDAFKDFRLRLDEAAAGEVGETLVLFLISSTFSLVCAPGREASHGQCEPSALAWPSDGKMRILMGGGLEHVYAAQAFKMETELTPVSFCSEFCREWFEYEDDYRTGGDVSS